MRGVRTGWKILVCGCLLLGPWACSDKTPAGPSRCASDQDCPDGMGCRGDVCRPLCTTSEDCGGSGICTGGFCLTPCSGDGDCPRGEHCAGDYCAPDALPDAGSGVDADGGGGDGGGGSGDMPICDEVEITGSSVPPNLMLVVDKSGSMREPTDGAGSPTKLQALKTAVHAMLDEGRGQIRFGWMSFPNDDFCEPGRVTVGVGDDTTAQVGQRVDALSAGGGTPTGETLQVARAYYRQLGDSVHRDFVLLITDGLPTCPNGNGRNATAADAQLALQAVSDLADDGVDTFVIGLGDGVNSNQQLLNDMAEAGGWPRAGATKYYEATTVEDLQRILSDIGGMVMGCELLLDVVPEFSEYLWVYFDGRPVPRDRDHQDGFDYDSRRNAIVFYGSYCDQLRSGQVEHLQVLMGCAPPD